MPIDTVLTGEEARTVANETGVTRLGFDGNSCYYFLKDGSAIEIKPILNSNLRAELKFVHRVLLPTDKSINTDLEKKLTEQSERNKKTSKTE